MGDFLLDFRPMGQRRAKLAADLMRFTESSQVTILDEPAFSVALTFTGSADLWAPYRSEDGSIVAVAGRVSLDEVEWQRGESMPGTGGLASKAVYTGFRKGGLSAIEALGGNCVFLVYDAPARLFHLITDWAGAFPAFQLEGNRPHVFGSHPDVLAGVSGENGNLDEASLAEFLLTSTVTPPFTYYNRIKAIPQGTTTSIRVRPEGALACSTRKYLDLTLQSNPTSTAEELADELAQAFRDSVRRRTLPRLGPTAVALSGGLDSRALLACVEDRSRVFAFCCYNERNRELATAEAIARALEVPFYAWQRDFEYYGRTAEAGSRISGGMGTFANNHFLGVIDRIREAGASNLLTGCYCDYLFKGLPLNRQVHWFTGAEQVAPFQHQFYFSHHPRQSPLGQRVRERLQARVPTEFQRQDSDAAIFQVEARRTFPLCYEGDNQQRLVPQRTTGWYLPMADRAIRDVYCKIPSRLKLNRALFTKAVLHLCQGSLSRVPDANTGALVGASMMVESLHYNWSRVRRRLRPRSRSLATDGSWPDWPTYVARSGELRKIWQRPHQGAAEIFRRVLSPEDIRPEPANYRGEDMWLLLPMLTLKLWFEQWHPQPA
jgi:asparagine synthetase B (glutamine-hydrolysing)